VCGGGVVGGGFGGGNALLGEGMGKEELLVFVEPAIAIVGGGDEGLLEGSWGDPAREVEDAIRPVSP